MAKMRKSGWGAVVCIVLMFVWIFVTLSLTGGRDPAEFTTADWDVFAGFVVAEVLTIIALIVLVKADLRASKAEEQPDGASRRKVSPVGWVLMAAAFVVVMAAFALGVWLRTHLQAPDALGWALMGVGVLLPAAFALISELLRKQYDEKWTNRSVAENQQYIWAHREAAEAAGRMLKKVRRIRRWTDAYAMVIALCALVLAVGDGIAGVNNVIPLLAAMAILLSAASHLRLPVRGDVLPAECRMAPETYPELYAMARKAAATQQYRGKIELYAVPGSNAGIGVLRGRVMLQLGVQLVNTLSQEELYQLMLHEFAHYTGTQASWKERGYWVWLANGGTPVAVPGLVKWLFSYAVTLFIMEYQLYEYAEEVGQEQMADEAMCRFGDARTASSALIKTTCWERYEWEKNSEEGRNVYKPEELQPILPREMEAFRAAMETRSAFWLELLKNEIMPRSATHPILRMRLAQLGDESWTILPMSGSEGYRKEQELALQQMEALMQKAESAEYAQSRKEQYLEPLAVVEDWENRGCPMVAEEYPDVVNALRTVGRLADAEALCERAIGELADAGSRFAKYTKGCMMLYRYDPAGQALIYEAMEQNNNFVNEGLQLIGEFCCMMGRQADLDYYREKAVELDQRAHDTYNHIDELEPGDNLSAEQLPEGMLEGILAHLQQVGQDKVAQVYLVRKTVTEDFFASAVVIRFAEEADEEVRSDVLHKMFLYLDTSTDWQFSLFDYREVEAVRLDRIDGSVVYTKE